jgi:hypothetical protein
MYNQLELLQASPQVASACNFAPTSFLINNFYNHIIVESYMDLDVQSVAINPNSIKGRSIHRLEKLPGSRAGANKFDIPLHLPGIIVMAVMYICIALVVRTCRDIIFHNRIRSGFKAGLTLITCCIESKNFPFPTIIFKITNTVKIRDVTLNHCADASM